MVVDGDEVDEEGGAAHKRREERGADEGLLDPRLVSIRARPWQRKQQSLVSCGRLNDKQRHVSQGTVTTVQMEISSPIMREYRLPPKKPQTGAVAAYTKMMVVSNEPRLRSESDVAVGH